MVISYFRKGYNILLDLGDPRVKHLPFMDSFVPILTILTCYLLFIFKIGPKMMKSRQPYDLTKTIKVYNLIQIFANIVGFGMGLVLFPKASIFCTTHGSDGKVSPDAMRFVIAHYLYMLLKGLDLFDTIFFVLRKKYKQITFLHLYHHITMLLGSWILAKYKPGGQLIFLGFANVIVHIVMYIYYFLTSLDPQYKKSIWWKKHITQLQITQHCFVFVSFLIPLLNKNCTYPKPLLILYLPAVALMIYLFTDFYIKAYHSPKKESTRKKS